MRIKCSRCGSAVSNANISDDTIIRAYIECPECIDKSIDFESLLEEESRRTNILLVALECIAEGDCSYKDGCLKETNHYKCDCCRAKDAISKFHERKNNVNEK